MIPWYIYAGTAVLLVLGFLVHQATVFLICALAAGAMITPIMMGLPTPIWLEMSILFPALCLILAFVAGRPRAPEAVLPHERDRSTSWRRQ